MGAGTEIVLVARDGYESAPPIAHPSRSFVQERQGDAILAWWADGKYVPYYDEGMRLFFTPTTTRAQWDMHETLPEKYWYWYGAGGIMYRPSHRQRSDNRNQSL